MYGRQKKREWEGKVAESGRNKKKVTQNSIILCNRKKNKEVGTVIKGYGWRDV